MYGYEIAATVARDTDGVFQWKEGSLYPCLHKLERDGLVASRWEQAAGERKRKYYALTEEGAGRSRSKNGLLEQDPGGRSRPCWRNPMNQLERYLDAVCAGVGGSADLRRSLREELREHLENAVEVHRSEGITEDEAIARAIAKFGESGEVRSDFQSIYGRRAVALLIERAVEWKERNMKNDWKWSFVANFAVLLTLALLLVWMACVMVFITPIVVEQYHNLGTSAPDHLKRTIAITDFVHSAFLILAGLVLAVVVWFEWRCRSDYKGCDPPRLGRFNRGDSHVGGTGRDDLRGGSHGPGVPADANCSADYVRGSPVAHRARR